ncbi:MAG: hypothetical protein RLZZ148_2405 [Cyanobacteriota bacterium]|jgi:hypothetical protein
MNTTTNQSINPNLAGAALSLQTVRNYRRDRPVYGKKRVNLYFEDNLGDWLNQAVVSESINFCPSINGNYVLTFS